MMPIHVDSKNGIEYFRPRIGKRLFLMGRLAGFSYTVANQSITEGEKLIRPVLLAKHEAHKKNN